MFNSRIEIAQGQDLKMTLIPYANTGGPDQLSHWCCLIRVFISCLPVSVAQLDARPTGDQEVAGSTPAESATFFRRDLIK